MSRNVHLRDIAEMEGKELAEYVNRRESCLANKRCITKGKSERKRQRKDETRGQKGDRREAWDVQVRQYTKGSQEITIFHSFARSNYFVQLKYRFSPPSPRLSRVRLCNVAHSLSLFRPFLPEHPPYGNIDRAQPRDSFPSHPRLFYSYRFLSITLFFISFPSLLFLSFSFLSLSLSLLFFSLSPPTLFRLQYSIIGYASACGPLAKSGKRSRLRFLHVYKRAHVSLPSYGCRLTMRPRRGK